MIASNCSVRSTLPAKSRPLAFADAVYLQMPWTSLVLNKLWQYHIQVPHLFQQYSFFNGLGDVGLAPFAKGLDAVF